MSVEHLARSGPDSRNVISTYFLQFNQNFLKHILARWAESTYSCRSQETPEGFTHHRETSTRRQALSAGRRVQLFSTLHHQPIPGHCYHPLLSKDFVDACSHGTSQSSSLLDLCLPWVEGSLVTIHSTISLALMPNFQTWALTDQPSWM